ncbi:MAG TPA: NTP transferase domain-containing protein, partial [Candidatus Thalassarchaeaceae archaeon]
MRSLILAGGKSTRMGRDKCLIEIGGVACIQRVAMALAEAGLEPIRISVESPEHMEEYGRVIDSSLQVEWVVDSFPNAGPIEAILDALTDPFCNNPLQ